MICSALTIIVRRYFRIIRPLSFLILSVTIIALVGCGIAKTGKKKDDFFTSGSREADQRATQRMAKDEQLSGNGEGAGEKGVTQARTIEPGTNGVTNTAAQVEGKLALFDRLGSEAGISNIVADFMPRVLNDPRVNWQRNGVKRAGIFSVSHTNVWNATPANVETLKKHLFQFLNLVTGGPAQYEGKEIKSTHTGMRIENPEFDAVIGDLKASLDRLRIPNKEQKELLAIVESTRPQIVSER